MQYVTRQESSQTYCSVRVVANIIMRPAWRSVPHPSSGQDGSVQSVKCARHAGVSSVQILSDHCIVFTVFKDIYILIFHFLRKPGEDSKMLVCDACDKGYHTFCLQPAMDSLPTDPWKCRVSHICQLSYFLGNILIKKKQDECTFYY